MKIGCSIVLAASLALVACGSRGDRVGCKEAWAIDLADWTRKPVDDTDAHVLAKDLREAGDHFLAVARLGGAPAPIGEIGKLLVRRATLLDGAGTEAERARVVREGGAPPPPAAPSGKPMSTSSAAPSAAASTAPSAAASTAPSAAPSPPPVGAGLLLSDASYDELRSNQAQLDETWHQFESECPR